MQMVYMLIALLVQNVTARVPCIQELPRTTVNHLVKQIKIFFLNKFSSDGFYVVRAAWAVRRSTVRVKLHHRGVGGVHLPAFHGLPQACSRGV